MLLGGIAGLFPDIDWLLGLVIADPLVYLNIHRGETHSLVLLPVWALLLGVLASRALPGGRDWRDGTLIAALGIGIHILGDWITNFGTQLLAPLSRETFAFATTFIIDPWLTGILLIALIAVLARGGRGWARLGLAAAAAWLVLQATLKVHALEHARAEAEDRGLYGAQTHAMPQPLNPLHWRLLIETDEAHLSAHLGFLADPEGPDPEAGLLARHWQSFQPPGSLTWEAFPRFGGEPVRPFVHEGWHRPEMAAFRRFAELPFLHRVVRRGADRCAIFADLRFRIAQVPPPFQYAICLEPDGTWYRAEVAYWERIGEAVLEEYRPR